MRALLLKSRAMITTTIIVVFGFPMLSIAQTGRDDLINQPGIDELVAKGARKLAAEELRTLLSGAVMAGPTWDNYNYRGHWKPDGELTMQASGGTLGETAFSGNWHVNDKGQFCWEGTWRWSGGRSYQTGCQHLFKLNAEHYTVSEGKILKREMKK